MYRFVMKAAGSSRLQIKDRIKKFEQLGIEPYIELHLSGLDDISDNCSRVIAYCNEYPRCVYSVHFPVIDHKNKYLFDMYNDEEDRLKKALRLCGKIKADILILHRCFGFNKAMDKSEAEKKFLDRVVQYNYLAKQNGIKILFENYGFVWLSAGFSWEFILSPLDHFFPWDILDFHKNINKIGLNNVTVALDLAHATLSSNMFNILKAFPQLRSDAKFKNIYASDLGQKDTLNIEDFIFDFIGYFHISDSFVWRKKDGIGNLSKYLYSEGLPLGSGNIDYGAILKRIPANRTLVTEIYPDGGNHNNNLSQLRAIRYIRKYTEKEAQICA